MKKKDTEDNDIYSELKSSKEKTSQSQDFIINENAPLLIRELKDIRDLIKHRRMGAI